MKGLVTDELERIETERTQIIEGGARRGQTLSVDKVLRHVKELKASYAAAGHTEEVRKLEQMIADFHGEVRV